MHILINVLSTQGGSSAVLALCAANSSFHYFPCLSSPEFRRSIRFHQHLSLFASAWKLSECRKLGESHGSPQLFPTSLGLLSFITQCLRNLGFFSFVQFSVVSDGRVNLVPVIPSSLEVKLIH